MSLFIVLLLNFIFANIGLYKTFCDSPDLGGCSFSPDLGGCSFSPEYLKTAKHSIFPFFNKYSLHYLYLCHLAQRKVQVG